MDDVKKHARYLTLTLRSNHELYEENRAEDKSTLNKKQRAKYEADAAMSRRIYNMAFWETIKRTTFERWTQFFDGFSKVAKMEEQFGGQASAKKELVSGAHRLFKEMVEYEGNYDHAVAFAVVDSAAVNDPDEVTMHYNPMTQNRGRAGGTNNDAVRDQSNSVSSAVDANGRT